jgi:hypothetical protein
MSILLNHAEKARNGQAIALLVCAMNQTYRLSPSRQRVVWGPKRMPSVILVTRNSKLDLINGHAHDDRPITSHN